MNEKVKRYKGVATLYMIFSFIPFLFIIDQSDNISYMPAIIILVLSQFILTFFGSDSKIFYEFNSYIANAYKVKDFDIDPRELKNTDLTGYVFTIFGYMIPLFCTIQMIDIYSVEEQLGPGQIGALFNFIYLLIILFFYIIRLSKQIKYMDDSYPEDAIWTQARWDARKLYLDLTLNNHSLYFTPGVFKDSTFLEFKNLIIEKVENLKLYNKLDSDKQVVLKRKVVASICTYLTRECVDLYVDSGKWEGPKGPSFFTKILSLIPLCNFCINSLFTRENAIFSLVFLQVFEYNDAKWIKKHMQKETLKIFSKTKCNFYFADAFCICYWLRKKKFIT